MRRPPLGRYLGACALFLVAVQTTVVIFDRVMLRLTPVSHHPGR